MNNVLIIGGSSFLGSNLSKAMKDKGYDVYGTYNTKRTEGVEIKLDIQKNKDIRKVVKLIVDKRIENIVFAVGVSSAITISETTCEDSQKFIELNYLGFVRFMNELLKVKDKFSVKNVIVVTSVNSYISLPRFGAYSASKFALRAYCEAAHYELNDVFNLTMISPGAIKNIDKKVDKDSLRENSFIAKHIFKMSGVDDVCNVIIVQIKHPRQRTNIVVGVDAKIMLLLDKILPSIMWNYLMAKLSSVTK